MLLTQKTLHGGRLEVHLLSFGIDELCSTVSKIFDLHGPGRRAVLLNGGLAYAGELPTFLQYLAIVGIWVCAWLPVVVCQLLEQLLRPVLLLGLFGREVRL